MIRAGRDGGYVARWGVWWHLKYYPADTRPDGCHQGGSVGDWSGGRWDGDRWNGGFLVRFIEMWRRCPTCWLGNDLIGRFTHGASLGEYCDVSVSGNRLSRGGQQYCCMHRLFVIYLFPFHLISSHLISSHPEASTIIAALELVISMSLCVLPAHQLHPLPLKPLPPNLITVLP